MSTNRETADLARGHASAIEQVAVVRGLDLLTLANAAIYLRAIANELDPRVRCFRCHGHCGGPIWHAGLAFCGAACQTKHQQIG